MDGSFNEWPEFAGITDTVREEKSPVIAATTTDSSVTPCILTVRTASPIFDKTDAISNTLGIDELYVDLSSKDGLSSALDQETWSSFIRRLLTFAKVDALKSAVLGAFGETCNQHCRGDHLHGSGKLAAGLKEKTRIEMYGASSP